MNEENEQIDLLEGDWNELPIEVQEILNKFSENENDYDSCANLVKELNAVGYTIDYYLDAEPFNLQKL